MSTEDATAEVGEEKVENTQKSVTLKESTIERLEKAHPNSIDDSERIRRAIADSIELQEADSYQITRRDE